MRRGSEPHRPRIVEAIILAGGRAERLGDAARGRPKALVSVGGRPLLAYQLTLLARSGVRRVIVSCAVGQGEAFVRELAGSDVEIVPVEEPEPLGRGGGLRFAAAARLEAGPVYALNGDELLDVDLARLLERHLGAGAAATITVTQPFSPFGVVELAEGDLVSGFDEGARVPCWVSCGVYVLGEEALARFPERGDHETTTFPELAAEGRLAAFRHEGLWLTVNTPKDLRRAEEHLAAHPGWPAA
jgi:NDP-sugar pyrophosphorylase family protein